MTILNENDKYIIKELTDGRFQVMRYSNSDCVYQTITDMPSLEKAKENVEHLKTMAWVD